MLYYRKTRHSRGSEVEKRPTVEEVEKPGLDLVVIPDSLLPFPTFSPYRCFVFPSSKWNSRSRAQTALSATTTTTTTIYIGVTRRFYLHSRRKRAPVKFIFQSAIIILVPIIRYMLIRVCTFHNYLPSLLACRAMWYHVFLIGTLRFQ